MSAVPGTEASYRKGRDDLPFLFAYRSCGANLATSECVSPA